MFVLCICTLYSGSYFSFQHFASSDALEVYEILVKKIASIKTQRKMSMSQNQQLQNTFFVKKMTITQRVGQLTNSVEKVKEIVSFTIA